MSKAVTEPRKLNPALAILLAALLPFIGAGHIYVGTLMRALVFSLALWVLAGLWAIFLIFSVIVVSDRLSDFYIAMAFASIGAIIAVWVWQVWDARSQCERHNASLQGK